MLFSPWNIQFLTDNGGNAARISPANAVELCEAGYVLQCPYTEELDCLPVANSLLSFVLDLRTVALFQKWPRHPLMVLWDFRAERAGQCLRSLARLGKAKDVTLCISQCEISEILDTGLGGKLLGFVNELLLTGDYPGQAMSPSYVPLRRHLARRRPCRYPFDTVTVDSSDNVLPCAYRDVPPLAKFTSVEELADNHDYLRFLAAQLAGDLTDYPACQQCPYWLDGWLADEEEQREVSGQSFRLIWEGHCCRILAAEADR